MKWNIQMGLAVLVLGFPLLASGATWQIDPDHSSFQFKVRHMMASNVRGSFSKVTGMVIFNDDHISNSKGEAIIEAASINTGHAKRDEHLRSADFFDVARYPTLTFVSKQVTSSGSDRLRVTGDLTIHGVTREIVLDVQGPTPEVKDPGANFRRGLSVNTKINRKDFGLTWSKVLETGGLVVGDEVEISVEIELVRK